MTLKKAPVKKVRPNRESVAKKVKHIEEPEPAPEKVDKVPAAIARKAKRYEELKAEMKLMSSEVSELQAELVEFIEKNDAKLFTVDGRDFTRVQSESVNTDEEKLKKAIGATAFNKLTVRTLDPKLVDQAVKDGVLTTTLLASVSTLKKNKPYISMSK